MSIAERRLRRKVLRANEDAQARRKGVTACGSLYYLRYYHQIATLLGGAGRLHAFLRTRDVKAALVAAPAR
jgi:hypothetical protein